MTNSAGGQALPTSFSSERSRSGVSAAQLRAEFDRSFALSVQESASEVQNFIILQVAGREFALATDGLAAIERIGGEPGRQLPGDGAEESFDSRFGEQIESAQAPVDWVPVPSGVTSLLGIRAFNGRAVPGFALGSMLGLGAPAAASYCAIVAVGADLIAFAFDALVRFARVESEQILTAGPAAEPWQIGTLLDRGRPFAIIGIASLLQMLTPGPSGSGAAPTSALQDGNR